MNLDIAICVWPHKSRVISQLESSKLLDSCVLGVECKLERDTLYMFVRSSLVSNKQNCDVLTFNPHHHVLLLYIAQHLDPADIYALQLVRNDYLLPLLVCKFELMPSPRHAGTSATRPTPAPYIKSWPSVSSGAAAHTPSAVSAAFLIFRRTNLLRS